MDIEMILSAVNNPYFRIAEVGLVAASLGWLFWYTRNLSQGMGTVCGVLNVQMVNQIKLENRLNEHEQMLAHMAKMRAAKAAKKLKNAA